MQQIMIENRKCCVFENKSNGPVFIYINAPEIPVGGMQIIECLNNMKVFSAYTFIEAYIDEWDKNLSPWKAPDAANKGNFIGNGSKTLKWLSDYLIPYITNNYSVTNGIYLLGYSLSGLFAIWALYETDLLDGIGCCSGSLWYPDWDKYAEKAALNKRSLVYLSLGGKEETTKNPVMSSVGERFRKQVNILRKDPLTESVILEMNPGGHFSETALRVAKAIRWILREREEFGMTGKYNYYGWRINVKPLESFGKTIKNPRDLYDLLSEIWSADTCAPRMREKWNINNKTLGQCSITAFLTQDIFGGKVYGIPRPDGNFHCYNVVDGFSFDLTSEQFGNEILVYENNPEQFREVHFKKEEKRQRYEYLKKQLFDKLNMTNN